MLLLYTELKMPLRKVEFLTCFPKMKVGLSNHHSVSLCVCVLSVCLSACHPLITPEELGRFFMKFSTKVMQFKGTSMQ
jgi:hypothetical protein